jgi:hypothetical protein
MDSTNLSDYQLYEIIQNMRLDQNIRQAANDEFNKRKLSIDQIQQLIAKHDSQFTSDKEEGIQTKYKILLTICPLFIEIHALIAGRMLAKGQKQKWKDYWLFICLGYLTWTIAIMILAKYYLFRH